MENTKVYKSTVDGRMTDVFQYLTELICQRIARKDKRGELPVKFWNLPTWKNTYRFQLLSARSLLKLYSVEAVLKALRNCPTCYSLNARFLDEKIKIEQEKIDFQKLKQQYKAEQPKDEVPTVVTNESVIPRKSFVNEVSNLRKLNEL